MSLSTSSTSDQTGAGIPAGTWSVDPTHTRIGFVARHMMVTKVRGSFGDYSADVTIGDDPLASSLSATVQMASIDTGNADRDGHLRTNDFFDIEQHPTMSLRSTRFEADGEAYRMHADLTIKGVTRPVVFDLELDGVGQDPWGGTRAGFSATTTINRKDWGIEWNAPLETGGVLVGEKVQIELDVQLVKS
jgi:polyisoprenoid-binding protein YceI